MTAPFHSLTRYIENFSTVALTQMYNHVFLIFLFCLQGQSDAVFILLDIGPTVFCTKCCSYLSHKHPSNYNRMIDIKIQSLQNWVIPVCQTIFDSISIYKEDKLFERTVHRVATPSQKYYSMNTEPRAHG